MKEGPNLAILLITVTIITLIPIDFSRINFVFGQSGNTLAQEGVDNEASQSELSSQETNQNSMCVLVKVPP